MRMTPPTLKDFGLGHFFPFSRLRPRLSESEVAQSCPTLCDLVDCSLPGSSVRGTFQAIVLEWIDLYYIPCWKY